MQLSEAVCIASGPSLTQSDCNLVHRWRNAAGGRVVIVTNTTFRLCPWADYLFAMDNEWWRVYSHEVEQTFTGTKYSRYGNEHSFPLPCFHGNNSGAGAILLADKLKAARIILLGYDHKVTGRKHWHDDHPQRLGNCESIHRWPMHFAEVKRLCNADIVNATRDTALDLWPKSRLEGLL